MGKQNWKHDESNWSTLLLSLVFLASLGFLSLLWAACLLPRADPISHTHTCTHTHYLSHTHAHRSATVPKHPPHGYIQSPGLLVFSPLVLSLSLSPPFLLSLVLSKYPDSHGHSHKHSPEHKAHTDSCACTDRRRDGKVVILQDAGEYRGRVGKEWARQQRGNTEGGEKAQMLREENWTGMRGGFKVWMWKVRRNKNKIMAG